MPTVFRTTATRADRTGKYRTEIMLSSGAKDWSDEAKAAFVKSQPLPAKAYDVSQEEYNRLNALPFRTGYVEKAGDVDTDFKFEKWNPLI